MKRLSAPWADVGISALFVLLSLVESAAVDRPVSPWQVGAMAALTWRRRSPTAIALIVAMVVVL
ncbi:hypothetical protein U2054_15630, partial [Listeria monocytogenes]|uniref:hypothetical protein n=1 Tax=Listeria monocytogenes TaxID=1639 RepID=UPI002FDBEAD4